MKHSHLLTAVLMIFLVTVGGAAEPDAPGQISPKKGVGLAERKGKGLAELNMLKVAWYYNWGSSTKIESGKVFVPMIFSAKRLAEKVEGDVVLGFNEPDHEKQANLDVEQAIAVWPQVESKAKRVGAPAMAGNLLTSEWFAAFMKAKPRVDFINVHWYKGADSRKFIRDMEALHETFKLPIWITEFAPQTIAASAKEPAKYSQEQVDTFIRETTEWMERTPWIERYAWHDSLTGTSALFDATGALTATGKTYAAAAGARSPTRK